MPSSPKGWCRPTLLLQLHWEMERDPALGEQEAEVILRSGSHPGLSTNPAAISLTAISLAEIKMETQPRKGHQRVSFSTGLQVLQDKVLFFSVKSGPFTNTLMSTEELSSC